MGLHVHTAFETPEGFSVTDVYCRIVEFTFRCKPDGGYFIFVHTRLYLSRDRRLGGKEPVRTPDLLDMWTFEGPFGDIAYLYGLLKAAIEERGISVDNVFEPGQEPPAE
jgi:hypothetical protein